MPMDKKARRLALLILGLLCLLGAIPTWLYLSYGKRILPVIDLNSKSMELSQPLPQLPLTTIVTPDNQISTGIAKELSEEQKIGLTQGLLLSFRARVNNLAYFFPYFTMIQFGKDEKIWGLVVVFSQNVPQVGIEGDTRKVNWKGQRIGFDITRGQMIYAIDGFFEFRGQDFLEVHVYYSASLEPGKVGQPMDPRKIIPGEKF